MPKFFYTAKNYTGETKSGEMDAADERDLAIQVRNEGYIMTSHKELVAESAKQINIKFFDNLFGIPLGEKMIFARNLSVMISSGLPLSRAVQNLTAQTKNRRFMFMLKKIQEDLQAGNSFADSLAKYPAVFSELFVNMVRVGETGGNLEEVLNILAVQLEKEHDLISKVRGAMTYPAVIIVAMIGIGIIMLTYILPKITGVFEDMEVQLPYSTQLIISLSNFLRNHTFWTLGLFVFLVVFTRLYIKTESGKKFIGFVSIHFPVIKNIVIKVNCARFARIYSSLLKSGVSVVEALKIVSKTLTNYYYKKTILNGVESVQKGLPLSKVVAANQVIFPVLVNQMIEVGEETGKTETVLLKLAEFYEAEIDQITKNLSSVIEPVLMILIGGAVGFFAVSMLQPMYSLMENIK